MHKKSFQSITGKLILSIGIMMMLSGFFVAYIFKKNNPHIEFETILIYGGFFVFVISLFLCLILHFIVTKPLFRLVEGMERLSKGDLDCRIDLSTKDEISMLANSFNRMASDLRQYKERMENWTKELEEEVKKKTSEIMKAQEQLVNAEKLASLGRMAAGVAHELNNPLTGIVTFAHLLKKRMPPENKQDIEDINVIIEQADRCSKIINGLLGFSRKTTTEKIKLNINTLIENTLALLKNQARFHNIRYEMNLDNSIPEIIVDPNQIQQVFINLLINAADAMNENGLIIISTRPVEDKIGNKKYVEIEFTDTGPGIPKEQLARIFEPFYTTKPVGKGTGLGLAVSYGIIKKHGGSIDVKSEYGKGASFFVRLPVKDGS